MDSSQLRICDTASLCPSNHRIGALPTLLSTSSCAISLEAAICKPYQPGALLEECAKLPRSLPCLDSATHLERSKAGLRVLEETGASFSQESPNLVDAQPTVFESSRGSLHHGLGLCSPCGFFHHKNGCSLGFACKFCHLCPPGSIEKQRKKNRKSARVRHAEKELKVGICQA
mmetsp:Transcript_96174/g.152123  ORF Transcript_96174/g.152123 Transcript_96174/m.152123 type:complete len:173 (-) Transcript_96174:31-549(-)